MVASALTSYRVFANEKQAKNNSNFCAIFWHHLLHYTLCDKSQIVNSLALIKISILFILAQTRYIKFVNTGSLVQGLRISFFNS